MHSSQNLSSHSPTQPPTSSESESQAWSALERPRHAHILEGADHTPEYRALPSAQAEVALAVSALHEGRPVIVGRYPQGVYRELVTLECLQDSRGTSKGAIALATRYSGAEKQSLLGFPTLTWVYFPTPTDAIVYYQAGASSYRAGPSDLYPGSVGALELVHDPVSGIAQIVQLQSSVRIANTAVSALLKQPGSSLCTRYQKWSSRLLEHAFDYTRQLGISDIAVAAKPETALPLSAPVRNISMICRKAATCGFTLSGDKSLLRDSRSRG